MSAKPFDFSQILWRERGMFALLVAIGSFLLLGHDLTRAPVESLSIWRGVALGALFAAGLGVFCTTSTKRSGGAADGSWSGASSDSGGSDSGSCGGDSGGGGGDGGSC